MEDREYLSGKHARQRYNVGNVSGNSGGRRLKLLQLVHCYPPAMGGVEVSTRDLCKQLVADYGMDVTVFTTDGYTVANFQNERLPRIPIRDDEEQDGVKIRRFPVIARWSGFLRMVQWVAWRSHLPWNDRLRTWFNGPRSPEMLRAVQQFDADVVCAASFPLNHVTYPFRGENNTPVVLVGAIHTNNAWGYERPHLIRLVRRAYATIAHTEHERQWLIKRGAPAEKVAVIGHGIEIADFAVRSGAFRNANKIPPEAIVIAYVGQQGAHKGIDNLIRVFPELLTTCPFTYLVIAGATTPFSARIQESIAKLDKQQTERCLLLNDVSNGERAAILADCDIFASPSAQESFGITTLEAWSQSKPVLVGDGPAQRAVVENGRAGMLVRYGDNKQLLESLKSLMLDEELRKRLGEAGKSLLEERYNHDAIVKQYHTIFKAAAVSAGGHKGAAQVQLGSR